MKAIDLFLRNIHLPTEDSLLDPVFLEAVLLSSYIKINLSSCSCVFGISKIPKPQLAYTSNFSPRTIQYQLYLFTHAAIVVSHCGFDVYLMFCDVENVFM